MAVFKLIQSGRCNCGAGASSEACKCVRDDRYTFSFRFRGKQYTRRTDATTKEAALKLEANYLKLCRSQSLETQMAVLKHLNSDESRMRRVCSSLGEVKAAYMKSFNQWKTSESGSWRNVTSLDLVVAYGLDLWTVNEGGRKGVKKGAKVADVDRIDKLSTGVLTDKLVRDYFLARQKSAGIATDAVVRLCHPAHVGFNGTLNHARDLFGENARRYAFADLSLPDLSGFLKEPLLIQKQAKPEPFSMPEFSELCALFDGLKEAEPELWLMNLIHRQTGLRPRYVMSLRGSWLEAGSAGTWFIKIKDRMEEGWGKKEGTDDQLIPLTPELHAEIVKRGDGLIVAGTQPQVARDALQKRHKALIKRTVKDEGSHGQGYYRYRDTVACVLGHLYGVEAARLALGHKTSLTTLTHYCQDLPDVSDLMRSELAAWLNLPSIRRKMAA